MQGMILFLIITTDIAVALVLKQVSKGSQQAERSPPLLADGGVGAGIIPPHKKLGGTGIMSTSMRDSRYIFLSPRYRTSSDHIT